jgi:hypothetical protein
VAADLVGPGVARAGRLEELAYLGRLGIPEFDSPADHLVLLAAVPADHQYFGIPQTAGDRA